jgi:glycosyltransferase involved in cell wall biosynthesis
MPVRNPGPEFERTLASFATLDLKPFLIIVDDASRPPLNVDFARYGMSGRVIRQPESAGIAPALNVAFRQAYDAGFEFIARMDGDDLNLPQRFSTQLRYMDAHPECLAVFADAELIDAHDAPLGRKRTPHEPAELRRAMAVNNVLLHPTAVLRREFLTRYGFYDPLVNLAEDYDYFMRGVVDGVVDVIPEPLIRYRVHAGGVSYSKYRAQVLARIRTQLRFLRRTGAAGLVGLVRSLAILVAATVIPTGALGRVRQQALAGRQARAQA